MFFIYCTFILDWFFGIAFAFAFAFKLSLGSLRAWSLRACRGCAGRHVVFRPECRRSGRSGWLLTWHGGCRTTRLAGSMTARLMLSSNCEKPERHNIELARIHCRLSTSTYSKVLRTMYQRTDTRARWRVFGANETQLWPYLLRTLLPYSYLLEATIGRTCVLRRG